jgi:KaiC/GvpD/RAD55 family RecA-like ATPase
MTATVDFRAQAEEFAQWLCNLQGKGKRRFTSRTKVSGHCPKPGHDDKHPSFGYDLEKDAYACSCSAGKGSELMAALGWKSEKPVNGNLSMHRVPVQTPFHAPPSRPPDETYQYANGNRKLKWRMGPGEKSIVVWRHESGKSGKDGEAGLYRLAEALKEEGCPIHVSESESDVDALWELGFAATATHAGAASPWKELPKELAGRQLVVWEHQDDPGRKYAAAMVEVAKKGGADAVVARPKEGFKDVREWILALGGADEIGAVAKAALLDFPLAESADELLAADLPPPDYVINPIAIRSNLTLIQGEPKAGKSVITLYLAACAALGIWTAGRWNVPRQIRTLYITWEDGRRRIQKRLRQFLIGMGEPFKPIKSIPNLFFYSKSKGKFKAPRIRLEEPAGRALLKKLILGHGAEFVVLDTLSHMTGVDENSKKDMQPVVDALTDIVEETDCAIAFNHHTGKEGKKSTTYRSRGTSVIPAAADVILDLGNRGKTNTTPCRLISREDDPDSFLLEYLPEGEDLIRFKLVDEKDDSEEGKEEKYAVRKKIIENLSTLCANAPLAVSRGQVAKACEIPTNTATRHLEQMVEECSIQKKLIQTPNGPTWRYAPISHIFPKETPHVGGAAQ